MQIQSSIVQRGLAADIRQRANNSSRKLLSRKDRRFLNGVVHDRSLAHQPDVDERLMSLATRSGACPFTRNTDRRRESSQLQDGDGLSSAFAAFGALAALGTGAYYTYQEQARKREERQRKERQFKITVAAVVLGVIGLWYSGWFFVVFGLVFGLILVALLVACTCSS